MKRTETEIGAALFLQLHISGNHIHDIIFHPYFFDQIFRIIHSDLPKNSLYVIYSTKLINFLPVIQEKSHEKTTSTMLPA